MNTNTEGRRTSTFARRAVPALAIVVLAIGLGACQTPRGEAVAKAPVVQAAQVPEGIDTSRPADRIVEELARRAQAPATHFPSWTARVTAQLEYEAQLSKSPSVQLRGRTADTIDRLTTGTDRIARELARRAQAPATHFPSWTARVTAQLEYEAQLSKSPPVQLRGRTADTIDRLTSNTDRFSGLPADRIEDQLEREVIASPRFY